MKERRLTATLTLLAFATLFACCCSCFAQDAQEHLLRHRYAEGTSATNEISIRMHGTMRMEENEPFPYDATVTIRMPITALKVAGNGDTTLEIRVREMSNEQRLGQETQKMVARPGWMTVDDEVIFDRRTDPGVHPLGELFGTRATILLSPRGELKDFSTLKEIPDLVPNVDLSTQLSHGFVVFPEVPIKAGHSWKETDKVVIAENTKPVKSVTEYRLERVEKSEQGDQIAIISLSRSAEAGKVVVDGRLPSQPESGLDQVDVKKLTINEMKQEFHGTVRFDLQKGRVIETVQTGTHFVDSTADLAFQDQKLKQNSVADLQLEITTRMTYER